MAVACSFLGHQTLKEVPQIQRDVWIGILLNHQRTGGVLNEQRQKAVGNVLLGKPLCCLPREGIKSLAVRGNRQSGVGSLQRVDGTEELRGSFVS